MRIFLLITLVSLLAISCFQASKNSESHAFIGGEIVNPNTRFVVLSRGEQVIDTVFLDSNNRFLYKMNNLQSGLYMFRHDPENQIVLLEDGDSLHFRLNTMEFDESLVFTGKGSKKNNYLINLFLENEKENDEMLEYSQLSPVLFDHKIDSTTKIKHEKLKIFERKNSTSEIFNEIADANIYYNYYANKEIYPFAYYGRNELKNLNALPKDFYSYRSKVDYNNENLRFYFPYYRFLNLHFNNVALDRHFKHSMDSVFKKNSLEYNLDRLAVIDSLVSNDSIRNTHLKHTAKRFIYSSKNIDEIHQFVDDYLNRSTNVFHKKEIKELVESFARLTPGTKIPSVALLDHDGKEQALTSIITKPTVIYFWMQVRKGPFRESHLKAKKLKEYYPEIDFIAIYIGQTTEMNWLNNLKEFGFSVENEYRFANSKKGRQQLVMSSIYTAILVDENGVIINADANMSHPNFEEQLLALLNQ